LALFGSLLLLVCFPVEPAAMGVFQLTGSRDPDAFPAMQLFLLGELIAPILGFSNLRESC
jgi:hypothetical protein